MAFGVTVDFNANVAKFTNQVNKLGGDLDKFGKRTESVFSKAKTAVVGFLGVLTAARIGSFVSEQIDAADQIQKLSIRLGIGTEALSQYQFVAEQTGLSFQTLTTAFQRQTRRIAEAAEGTGVAVKSLKELGLSAEALNQLAPEQQFEAIADRIDALPNQADKVRLSFSLWDSEGVSLLQTLEGGSDAIIRMRNEADDLNLTLTRTQADAAAGANDALNELSKSISGGLTQSILNNVDQLERLADGLKIGIPAAVQFTLDSFNALRSVIAGTLSIITAFASGFVRVNSFIPGTSDSVGGLADELGNLSDSFKVVSQDAFDAIGPQEQFNKAQQDNAKETTKATEALERQLDSDAQRVFDNTRTELEKLNAAQARYKNLLDSGKISQDTFNRAIQQSIQDQSSAAGVVDELTEAEKRGLDGQREALKLKIRQAEIDRNNPLDSVSGVEQIELPKFDTDTAKTEMEKLISELQILATENPIIQPVTLEATNTLASVTGIDTEALAAGTR